MADENQILATIDRPSFEAMEAIGGTGDTLTGILSALCAAGFPPAEAAILAAKANRVAGRFVDLTPETQIVELIDAIPRALAEVMRTAEINKRNH